MSLKYMSLKFNIGDKVRVVQVIADDSYAVGDVAEVVAVDRTPHVTILPYRVKFSEYHYAWVRETELEAFTSPAPAEKTLAAFEKLLLARKALRQAEDARRIAAEAEQKANVEFLAAERDYYDAK